MTMAQIFIHAERSELKLSECKTKLIVWPWPALVSLSMGDWKTKSLLPRLLNFRCLMFVQLTCRTSEAQTTLNTTPWMWVLLKLKSHQSPPQYQPWRICPGRPMIVQFLWDLQSTWTIGFGWATHTLRVAQLAIITDNGKRLLPHSHPVNDPFNNFRFPNRNHHAGHISFGNLLLDGTAATVRVDEVKIFQIALNGAWRSCFVTCSISTGIGICDWSECEWSTTVPPSCG